MSRVLKIEISETVEELKKLLNSTNNHKVKERIQMLYWLKSEQAKSENAIANLIGKHRTTISRWLRTYRKGGMNGEYVTFAKERSLHKLFSNKIVEISTSMS